MCQSLYKVYNKKTLHWIHGHFSSLVIINLKRVNMVNANTWIDGKLFNTYFQKISLNFRTTFLKGISGIVMPWNIYLASSNFT